NPTASDAWRAAVEAALPSDRPTTTEWIRVDDDDEQVRTAATGAVARGAARHRRPAPAAELDEEAIARAAGTGKVPRLAQRLCEAARAFERERFTEARTLLRPLAERAPSSAPVRELYGLTLYRLGHWKGAA